MRKVLIVSPHFPPVNAADHQRVRQALPHLRALGWDPTILAVNPREVDGQPREPLLEATIPTGVPIVRTGAIPLALTRHLGARTLGLRAFPHLARAGAKLLRAEKFDLVFISTTQFAAMALGPRWRRRFGVPYVLDFQDPWVSEYHSGQNARTAPGGPWKYGFAQWLARKLEPAAVRDCAHAICVSPAYPAMLRARYAEVEPERFSVLPFGAAESDFVMAGSPAVKQSIFDPADGIRHWVYAGRGQSDMAPALRGLFHALAQAFEADPGFRQELRLHFIGTSYASGAEARPSVRPLAQEFGVADCVSEMPERIPYFTALRCLIDAEALILPGSDDPGYSASKLMPCVLAGKPLLAILHENSPAVPILRELEAGTVVTFSASTATAELGRKIFQRWFQAGLAAAGVAPADRRAPFLSGPMTETLAGIFDRACDTSHKALAAS